MDILGDATAALQNFARFALDGPTRYNDVGELYLRLYGLLGAAYTQQQAAFRLYKLMNCTSPQKLREKLNALTLRTLRHQLASHSLDYMNEDGKPSGKAFVPIRMELRGHNCSVTENRGDATTTYDLQAGLNEHCDVIISILDRIYAKAYKTLFRANKDKLAMHSEKLEELRLIRAGALVIRIPGAEGNETDHVLIIRVQGGNGT